MEGRRQGVGSTARIIGSAREVPRQTGRFVRPHLCELAKLVLVPAPSRRLVEHRVELRRVHRGHLVVNPLLAEPLRDVEDRHPARLYPSLPDVPLKHGQSPRVVVALTPFALTQKGPLTGGLSDTLRDTPIMLQAVQVSDSVPKAV